MRFQSPSQGVKCLINMNLLGKPNFYRVGLFFLVPLTPLHISGGETFCYKVVMAPLMMMMHQHSK